MENLMPIPNCMLVNFDLCRFRLSLFNFQSLMSVEERGGGEVPWHDLVERVGILHTEHLNKVIIH